MVVILKAHELDDGGAPRKRPSGSRSRKRRWKQLSQADEMQARHDLTIQQHRGGLLSAKPADQVFFVDDKKGGSKRKGAAGAARPRPLSRKQRAAAKTLHVETSVELNPNVKAFASVKRRPQGLPTRKSKRRREDPGSAGPRPRRPIRNIADLPTAWNVVLHEDVTNGDPWLEPVKTVPVKAPVDTGAPEASVVAAVEAPLPGTSYRPTYEDHQALLLQAHHFELKRTQALEDLEAQLPVKLNAAEQSDLLLQEYRAGLMSVGLLEKDDTYVSNDEDEDEAEGNADVIMDDDDESEFGLALALKKPVRPEDRKTAQQRRKQQAVKDEARRRVTQKLERKRKSDLHSLKRLQREIEEAERLKAEAVERRQQLKLQKKQATPRLLSRNKFRADLPDYKLTEELVDSLRQLKPEGSVFREKYLNLQKRNIIEARHPVGKRRRYQLKTYTKRSFKNYDMKEAIKAKQKELARQRAAKAAEEEAANSSANKASA